MHRVEKSCRNLPHWYREGSTAIYWITFRLADSLPQSALEVIRKERAQFIASFIRVKERISGSFSKASGGISARKMDQALGSSGSSLWMDESYDHIVRSKEELKVLDARVQSQ